MAMLPAVLATTAIAAYLNAKYHIAKDVGYLWSVKKGERKLAKAVQQNKVALWPYFEEHVQRLPEDDECIWSRTGCYTWKQTWAQSVRYAQFMLSHGVHKGQLVGMYMTNSPEFMFAHLGTWAIGCAPALINYNLADDALVHCVKLSGTKILLVDWENDCVARIEAVRSQLEAMGVKIINLNERTRAGINASAPIRPSNDYLTDMKPDFPMALIFTSGSTGLPKAVPFTVGRLLPHTGERVSVIGVKSGPQGDRYYVCMPMYHGTGDVAALTSLLNGVTLCIGKKFSSTRFWDEIRDSRSTVFVYVGEAARYLQAQPPSKRDREHNVRIIFGNGLRPDVWTKFQERFGIDTVAEFFNSSEGVFGTLNVARGPYQQKSVGHHGLLMRLLLRNYFVTAKIDHDSGDLLRDSATGFGMRTSMEEGGEVLVAVPDETAFTGYWKNKSATDKKFVRNLFKEGDLWYRTGDALRRTDDGLWYFLDRLGDTYRWKSENVATMEVAQTLGHFPGVVETAVYGVLVKGYDGRAGCAAINLADNQAPDARFFSQLLNFSNAKLPRYAVPVFIRLQRQVTPMHNQKQNKAPLKKDGINLDLVYGPGKDFHESEAGGRDTLYWWPAALGLSDVSASQANETRYVPFTRADLARIEGASQQEQARM